MKYFILISLTMFLNMSYMIIEDCIGDYHFAVTNGWNDYQDNLSSCSGFSASHCRREAQAIFYAICDEAFENLENCSS